MKGYQGLPVKEIIDRKVASINMSRLEASSRFFRLVMKGILIIQCLFSVTFKKNLVYLLSEPHVRAFNNYTGDFLPGY